MQIRAINAEDLVIGAGHPIIAGVVDCDGCGSEVAMNDDKSALIRLERIGVLMRNKPDDDSLLGAARTRPDDGGRDESKGEFHGSLGLNLRHITLVADGVRNVQRTLGQMNACSSWPYLPPVSRRNITKGDFIARSNRSVAQIFRLYGRGSPNQRRINPARPLGILKKSLTCCSVVTRLKCCSTDTTRAKWDRIFTRHALVARLLHCIVESLASPIGACADGDSRTEAVVLRDWNPDGACGIYW